MAENTARSIRRAVINKARHFTAIEQKVREATSNDPWGPTSTLLNEIAEATNNVVAFTEIMSVLWKRLNDDGKNWRHVYKSLVCLDYLVKTGSEKVADQCKKNIYAIETLNNFTHIDKDGKDQGLNVREKSRQLVNLLKEDQRLIQEREKSLKTKERFMHNTTSFGSDSRFYPEHSSDSNAMCNSTNLSSRVSSEIGSAVPSNPNEEDLQLQLALALSKEEAEKAESTRRNDDIRLQMAIEKSKEEIAAKEKKQNSNTEDLMSINFTSPPQSEPSKPVVPWGGDFPSPNDPFGGPAPDSFGSGSFSASNDPWATTPSESKPSVPAPVPQPNTISHEMFGLNWSNCPTDELAQLNISNGTNPPERDPFSLNDVLCPQPVTKEENLELPVQPDVNNTSNVDSQFKAKAEAFLGPNSKLVNFESFLTPASTYNTPASGSVFSTNPFMSDSSTSKPVHNPFNEPRGQQPSINELRNQNSGFHMNNTFNNPVPAGQPAGADTNPFLWH